MGVSGFGRGDSVQAFENRLHALDRSARHFKHVTRLQRIGFFSFVPVFRASPLLDYVYAEIFIFQISLHALQKTFHKALGDISLAFEEALSGHYASRDIGLVELRHIESLGEAQVLSPEVTRSRYLR